MKITDLEQEQIVFVMRYSSSIKSNSIVLHEQQISKYGFCWYGKAGMAPSKRTLSPVMDERKRVLILYNKEHSYICEFDEVISERPKYAYPAYYEEVLFGTEKEPKCYFRVLSIEEIVNDELSKFIVKSSGSNMLSALKKSMVSFVTGVYKVEVQPDVVASKKKEKTKPKGNTCRYCLSGICNLKTCVNYQYTCERPTTCSKQKI